MARWSSSEYSDKLKDPRWQRKRLEIFQRDNFTCFSCGATDLTLHVHHFKYDKSGLPWEGDDEDKKTVCEPCHKRIHVQREMIALADEFLDDINTEKVYRDQFRCLGRTLMRIGIGRLVYLDRDKPKRSEVEEATFAAFAKAAAVSLSLQVAPPAQPL